VPVVCPRCGREYDEGRFALGRTLWCACGGRVGAEPAPRALGDGPRFLADAMLGRLARWLRILGFDCAYASEIPDAELVRRAAAEGRILLSRDRSLPEEWRLPGILLVRSEEPREQIREIVRAFDLAGAVRLFSRCSECNEPLRPAQEDEVSARVPPRVRASHDAFLACPACGRVYWEGSHTERIRRRLEEVLGGSGPLTPPCG